MLAPHILAALAANGLSSRLRRGQRVEIDTLAEARWWAVLSGSAAIEAIIDQQRRQILTFLFPGDAFAPQWFAHMPGVGLRALSAVRLAGMAEACRNGDRREHEKAHDRGHDRAGDKVHDRTFADIDHAMEAAEDVVHRRQAVHTATIARLTGEEKVATMLLQLALAQGIRRGGATTIDVPMTRADMADYLGLNADTLSRILTRLSASDVVRIKGRTITVADGNHLLAAKTPLGEAVQLAWRR